MILVNIDPDLGVTMLEQMDWSFSSRRFLSCLVFFCCVELELF